MLMINFDFVTMDFNFKREKMLPFVKHLFVKKKIKIVIVKAFHAIQKERVCL